MEQNIARITYANEITLISLSLPHSGTISKILSAFAEHGINVDMISQTAPQGGAVRMSFTVSDLDLGQALTILGTLSTGQGSLSPEILPGNSKIVFLDADMVHTPGVAAKVLTLMADAGLEIMLITTSDVDISILVNSHYTGDALAILQKAFDIQPEETQF